MAVSTELAEVLAPLFGRSVTSVNSAYRYLREADLVSKAGRGIAAAQMTVEDCLTLVLALMGTEQTKDSAEVATRLANLRTNPASLHPVRDEGWELLRHIGLVPEGNLKHALLRLCDVIRMDRALGPDLRFRLRIYYPRYSASIVARVGSRLTQTISFGRGRYWQTADNLEDTTSSGVDLIEMRECSDRTFRRLLNLLSD